ncbi:acyl-CoA dehydrogenase family protein [Aromatoleum toluolicum]|uniref:Acyl-CoA dehydrogenase n=1 Tax=Aromatoleum toluolicum TaxID=90060 RepID=A0ABX1NBR1_9RHOO|nr:MULTISPECIES: acyl-CoA dehydrogenase family protein [Rhodocyclales]AKU14364.1 putative acyl-CoA dehydrogenase [Azoarcus sp. CIB]AYH45964.1 acyl-CoA dehydrogenase [Azoarcus sp. DN11]NMF96635.1 acyl-CoA dehydrogenase family protein [Aromatoleum toluolicum]CCH23015.1 putative acyl-CoA dehydrogenase [Azoarcus sp. CIB]
MIESLELTSIPAEDEGLRVSVRAFLDEALEGVPADVRARSWMGYDADFSRRLAAKGWLGLTLPKEYGGGGRSSFARFVVVEELLSAGAPVTAHWIADRQSGPLIHKYGSEAQKKYYLPRICRAEAFFCIGMSEPNSGSDLASVTTRAVRTDSGWKLNGRKIWTTNAYRSHYMIALVRTSGEPADRNKGLSQMIVDLSLQGVTVRPIHDITGDAHFCEVFFDDVMLGHDALIGAEGSGWEQVTAELAFERSGPERIYSTLVLFDEWLAFLCRDTRVDDGRVALLGRMASQLCVLRAMAISVTEKLARGESPVIEAALVKDLGTEFEQQMPLLIADSLGGDPDRPVPSVLLKTLAYVTQISPSFSLRGGTREILRGMIARGLGLR